MIMVCQGHYLHSIRYGRTNAKNMMLLALVLSIARVAQGQATPDIVYRYTDVYRLIWSDAGSGAMIDGAVWQPQNYQSEFCSLGDVATRGWMNPSEKAVLVSQRKSGALIHPTSFTLVWTDGGSGAHSDVAVYHMNAPLGYTCLGGVAVNSYTATPDSSKYCCVRNKYVVGADTMLTWYDRGSGAASDVSWWTVMRTQGEAYGILAGNFIAVSGYSKPSRAYLLRADERKVQDVWSLATLENKPLNLYEVSEVKEIWNDGGSGAYSDVSIWRAEKREGYYSVGDVAVASHSKPGIGILLRPTTPHDDSVRLPVSYYRAWSDRGSGAHKDVQIWLVNCPGGYVSLGNVATDGRYPSVGDVYCVKYSYTSKGKWGYVWRDHGSGANADVSIYEAQPRTSNQQTVRGFGAVSSYTHYPSPPYLLNKQFLTYWAEKPIEKIFMYNVKYNLQAEGQQISPKNIIPTTLENNSRQPQKATRTVSYTTSKSSTFTFSQAIQLGISVELTSGIPLVGATTSVSVSTTSTFTSGETRTETYTDSINAEVVVPGRARITAVITGTKYKADIPYSATIRKVYYDGTEGYGTITGIYKGVAVNEITVSFGEPEYLD